MREVIRIGINITESELRKRIILNWETVDRSIGGNFDVTELVLMAKEAFDACRERQEEGKV